MGKSKNKKTKPKNKVSKTKIQQKTSKKPKWGLLIAALLAVIFANTGLIVLQILGINNQTVKSVVIIILAVTAGILARPITDSLQKRFQSKD